MRERERRRESGEDRRRAPGPAGAAAGGGVGGGGAVPSGLRSQTVVAPFRAPPAGATADDALVECAICMEKFADGESLRTLPCLHKYHVGCIDRWLMSNRQCPICKHDVLESR